MVTSEKDLHYIIKFDDGSEMADYFKRYEILTNELEFKPTKLFNNDFLPGDDRMKAKEIKAALITWVEKHNGKTFKIKFFYE